jgi:hypothetical protein
VHIKKSPKNVPKNWGKGGRNMFLKKLIAIVAILVTLVVAPLAEARGGHHGGGHGSLLPVILGVGAAAIIVDALIPSPPPPPPVVVYQQPPPPPPEICYQDKYGEWRLDHRGNQYWREYPKPRRVQVPCHCDR